MQALRQCRERKEPPEAALDEKPGLVEQDILQVGLLAIDRQPKLR